MCRDAFYSILCSTTSIPCPTLVSTFLYSTLLYSTLPYSTLLYPTLLYPTLLYSTLLYSILLFSSIVLSLIVQSCIAECGIFIVRYYVEPYRIPVYVTNLLCEDHLIFSLLITSYPFPFLSPSPPLSPSPFPFPSTIPSHPLLLSLSSPPSTSPLGLVMVDCRNVKKILAAKQKRIAAELFEVLEKKTKEYADSVMEEFK